MISRPSRPGPRPAVRRLATLVALALLMPATAPLQAQDGAKPARRVGSSGGSGGLKAATPVTVNFVNADIEAVSRAMAAMIERQIMVDPRVKGTITVYSEQPMTVREAYLNYLAALRGLGFAIVDNAGLLKVVPEADAKLQAGTVQVGPVKDRGDQVITQIFRLNHENPNNLVAVLRPLISPNNTINANPGNSTLVITDYADNLSRLAKIIAALDQPAATDIEVVPLEFAVAADLAAMVQRLGEGGGGAAGLPAGVPGAAGGSGGVTVMPDARSNALIIRAANPARLAATRQLIKQLDRPGASGPAGTIHVVYLKNADATRLATVLRAAFGGGGSGGGAGSTSTFAGAAGQGGNALGSLGNANNTGASTAATTPVSQVAQPSTGGFVQADPATNSLVISAPEPLYRQIRAVIDQLDGRRAQVYVESMIVKVDAAKSAELGFQWQNLFGNKGDSVVTGVGTNFSAGTSNILNLSAAAVAGRTGVAAAIKEGAVASGLNIGLLKSINGVYALGAIAHFLETNTGANVLSTPNLVALDNEEAKIVIGQNVPFVTGSFSNTGANGGSVNPFQTIERKDVGLTLRIKSQIGEGGTIRMTVYQENSSVVGASSTAGPTTDKSAIETTVVVEDGQIMVLGGLLKDEYQDGEDRVPGLASLPFVGNLFKSEKRNRVKSNLMVFLRPTVMRTAADTDSLTVDRYDAIRSRQQQAQPAPSKVLQINEAPVLVPIRPGAAASEPLGKTGN